MKQIVTYSFARYKPIFYQYLSNYYSSSKRVLVQVLCGSTPFLAIYQLLQGSAIISVVVGAFLADFWVPAFIRFMAAF